MTTQRFSSPSAAPRRRRPGRIWLGALAALLAGLLLAPEPPLTGQMIRISLGGRKKKEEPKVAALLALEVGKARQRFDQGRRGLTVMTGPDGVRVHFRREVAALLDRTEQDLDQSIARVPEPELVQGLRGWAAAEIAQVRRELDGPAGERQARWQAAPGSGGPRAVAVIASLGGLAGRWLPLPGTAAKTATADPGTVDTGTSGALLDRVAGVIGRIFFLAETNDLEVKLWVGSLPKSAESFSFWSLGTIQGAPAAPSRHMPFNSKRDRVPRGVYAYRAPLGSGAVTEFLEYPPRPGAPPAMRSEPLNLVEESSFFCCDFVRKHCSHVTDARECRAGHG